MGLLDDIKRGSDWLRTGPRRDLLSQADNLDEEIISAVNAGGSRSIDANNQTADSGIIPAAQQQKIIPVTITPHDNVRVRIYNSYSPGMQVYIILRLLLTDGQIEQMVITRNPAATRAKDAVIVPLPSGAISILSASVSTPISNVQRGQCFVTVALVTSSKFLTRANVENITIPEGKSVEIQTLIQGYLVSGCALQYPGGRQIDSLEGPGYRYQFNFPTPPAGSDINVALPSNVKWKLQSFTAQLLTDGTVGNRGNILGSFGSSFSVIPYQALGGIQGPSQTITYIWSTSPKDDAQGIFAGSSIGITRMPLPVGFTLMSSPKDTVPDIIETSTPNLVITDRWQGLSAVVEEWIIPQE